MRVRRSTTTACLLAALSACTSLKNERGEPVSPHSVEDGGTQLDSGPSGDTAGAGGTGKTIGRASAAGRAAAGSGGTDVAAVSGGAGAPAGAAGMSSPAAGAPAPAGATAAPVSPDVAGKVVNFWRQPMEAVEVTIGSTTVTTDAQGAFRIPDVAATYDATLLISTTQNGQPMRFVWRYEGLTRRDPTLQAYIGNTPRGAWLNVRISNVDFARRREGDLVFSSYGGVTGDHTAENSTAAEERIRIVWEGPRTTRFTGHAFRMLKLPERIEPNDYYAYASATFEVNQDGEFSVEYDLKQGVLPHGNVIGTLDGPPANERSITMYMRFPDHANIELLRDPNPSPTFSYGIPSMPADATVTLVAWQLTEGGQFMHVDGIDKETENVALTFPPSVRQIRPAEGAVVDADTTFQWESEPKVVLFWANDDSGRDSVYVVTTKGEARLPPAPTFGYQPNHKFAWRLEAHGSYASVDDAAGPEGFLDTCAHDYRPSGPTRGKGGTLSVSVQRRVSIKP